MKRKLTASNVGRLPAPESGQIEYADKDLPGFSLRVTLRGVRSFVLHYRPRAGDHKGKLTRWTLGRFTSDPKAANGTDLLTLAQAREIARNARVSIRDQGADPARDSRYSEPEGGPETYSQAVEDYVAKYQIAKKGNRAHKDTKRLLLGGGAKWHDRPLAEITRRDIHDSVDTIMAAEHPYKANRTLSAYKTFFKWCAGRDKILFSPCDGIDKPFDRETPRDKHYSDVEIKTVWHGVESLGAHRAAFVKLAFLTGKRRGELAGLVWKELDLDEGFWTLPAERSKNKREHRMPLSALAVRILKSVPRIKDCPYVFPSRKTGRPMNGWNKFQLAVEDACTPEGEEKSSVQGFTFHVARHTLKTRLGELRIPPHIKDKVLHHAPPQSAGEGYDHYDYLVEQREALEAWADHVKSVVWPKGIESLHG